MLKMEGSGRFMRTFAHLNPRVALRYSFTHRRVKFFFKIDRGKAQTGGKLLIFL